MLFRSQETLARIENGNQKPRSGNLRQMMEKMGRSGDRIETGIQVEEYETLELKIEFSKFIHRKEYGNAEKVLSKIEEKLDCNLMKNYQYIETERVKLIYFQCYFIILFTPINQCHFCQNTNFLCI